MQHFYVARSLFSAVYIDVTGNCRFSGGNLAVYGSILSKIDKKLRVKEKRPLHILRISSDLFIMARFSLLIFLNDAISYQFDYLKNLSVISRVRDTKKVVKMPHFNVHNAYLLIIIFLCMHFSILTLFTF